MLAADAAFGTSFAPPLYAPQGVAVLQQTAAVVDTANHQLVIVDLSAPNAPLQRLGGRGTNAAVEGFLFPSAAAFAAADHLYVADSGNRHLDHYARVAGVWTWRNSVAPFAGIAPPVSDLLDVCAVNTNQLLLLEANGRLLSVDLAAGTTSLAAADSRWRRPVAIGRAGGSVWVVDAATHTVYEYDQSFTAVRAFGGYGANAGRLRTPQGIVVDAASGRLYVSEAVGARISAFDLTGAPIEQLVLPSDAAHALRRGALVAPGRMLFADAASNRVQAVAALAVGVASLNLQMLEFGPVGIGYHLTGEIVLQNGGDAPVTATGVSVRGDAFRLYATAPTFPAYLAVGETLAIPIEFAPERGGRAFGEVLITTSCAGAPVLSASLSGEGLFAEPTAIGLVLDTSGSMSQPSGALTKIERLQQAASLAVDLLANGGVNELSVTRFSSAATVEFACSALAPANASAAHQAICALEAAGSTSIGAGLHAALADLGTTMLSHRSLLVLTDGKENTSPMIETIAIPSSTTVYTVGLGLPQFVDAGKLEALASRTGGYFQVTDGSDLLLAKFFVQVYSDVIGQQVVVDPPVLFHRGQAREFPLWITRDDRSVTCIVAWEQSESRFAVDVVSPDGKQIMGGVGASTVVRSRYLIARVFFSDKHQAAVGRWLVRVHQTNLAAKRENAIVSVLVDSSVHLHCEFEGRYSTKTFGTKPVGSAPTTERVAYPPRGIQAPPMGLRVGDGLTLRVSSSAVGVRIDAGSLEMWPPVDSLVARLRQSGKMNLDEPKYKTFHSDMSGQRAPVKMHSIQIDKAGMNGRADLNFNGPDGVYWARLRVEGANGREERWRRERSFQVLVRPKMARRLK